MTNTHLVLWDFSRSNKQKIRFQMAPSKTFYPTSPPLSHRQLKHPHKIKINKIMLSASPFSVFHAEHTISELKCKSDSKRKKLIEAQNIQE